MPNNWCISNGIVDVLCALLFPRLSASCNTNRVTVICSFAVKKKLKPIKTVSDKINANRLKLLWQQKQLSHTRRVNGTTQRILAKRRK